MLLKNSILLPGAIHGLRAGGRVASCGTAKVTLAVLGEFHTRSTETCANLAPTLALTMAVTVHVDAHGVEAVAVSSPFFRCKNLWLRRL